MKKSAFLIYITVSLSPLASCTKDKVPAPPDVPKDIDGNVLELVTIGTQTWTSKNLTVSRYRNGDEIFEANTNNWGGRNTGAWCYYENNNASGITFGKLYNWYAVNDPRGLAPEGFHIPSEAEWTVLITFLGGDTLAANKMKEVGTSHWYGPNNRATNSTSFTALPGGFCEPTGWCVERSFMAAWWTATQFDTYSSRTFALYYNHGSVTNDPRFQGYGFSVRCLKD